MHTLFESGITRINDLERYVKDDVVRYGGRLAELEKKLANAYREAVWCLVTCCPSMELMLS